jgi:hypothetical protein
MMLAVAGEPGIPPIITTVGSVIFVASGTPRENALPTRLARAHHFPIACCFLLISDELCHDFSHFIHPE